MSVTTHLQFSVILCKQANRKDKRSFASMKFIVLIRNQYLKKKK